MKSIKSLLLVSLLLSLCIVAFAQSTQSTELNITVGERRVKFVPTRSFQEMRYQVFNDRGELVFSAATSEAELLWALKDSSDNALAPGLYRYVLTLKIANDDERPHQGHFIIEQSQDQLWLTTKDNDEISGAALTATRAGGRSLAGLNRNDESATREIKDRTVVEDKSDKQSATTKNGKAEKASLLGTQNKIAKFAADGVTLVDSAVTDTGHITIDSATNTQAAGSGSLIIEGNANKERVELRSAGVTPGPALQGRGFGGTIAAPTATQANSDLFIIGGSGHNSSSIVTFNAGTIKIRAEENWTTTANGAYINFETTPSGSPTSSRVERMRITGSGNVGIGNTSPGAKLDVTGTINSTQYNLFGSRVLSTPSTSNLLVGKNAGPTNLPGRENTVVGEGAGAALSDGTLVCAACTEIGLDAYRGSHNMFLGLQAGAANTTGYGNTFGGTAAGRSNTFGANNTFTGAYAGYTNAGDNNNAFYGAFAGAFNAGGTLNTFIGTYAGKSNTTADRNVFTGAFSGYNNSTGEENAFLGAYAGFNNISGHRNTYVGQDSGQFNLTGSDNTFLGRTAGNSTISGSQNTFVGSSAGDTNNQGTNNTALGFNADFNALNHSNATAIGANALVGCSNCLVLGSINGTNAATSDTNVGIGVTAPLTKLHVADGGGNILFGNGGGCAAGTASIGFAASLTCNNYSLRGTGTDTILNRPTGGKVLFRENHSSTQMAIDAGGNVGIGTASPADKLEVSGDIRVGTGTTGCVKDADATVIAGNCSSDLRFKHSVRPLSPMLGKVSQLRPVNFFWRASEFPAKHFGERESFGLIAQEVEAVLPELVTTDEQGFKAVNYSKLPLLTIQAVKELKSENDALKERLKTLEEQMRQLLEAKTKEQK